MKVKKGDTEYNIPDDLRYIKSHQWVKVEGNKAKIGITDYAQKILKEVIFVEFLTEVGAKISATKFDGDKPKGEPFGTVESTKGVSEIFSVLSGEVVEINEALMDDPAAINGDCYGEGWMIVVSPSNKDAELKATLDASAYAKYIQSL